MKWIFTRLHKPCAVLM